jgi:predicted DNA binding CopG/RHH family protein
MKYYELDKEEQDILDSVENDLDAGTLKSVKNVKKEIKRYHTYAQNTLNKNRSINIRLSERDLMLIKRKAMEQGLPYQTLIASILHQYGNKRQETE